ncbi:uncharacterized protein LOC132793393 [Drosophila nasuta]|uniref:uncharacterized protein LOC132793393 n=1 Tax=Drosophila nasuta TaxID=42062 RepID=UPI00295E21A2|nr:uncharacterized protein LOC132793393 [Drosophila nasuta]
MKIDLSVDEGPCNSDLRSWCLGIAIYFLVTILINVIFSPSVYTFIGFAITVIGNVCLLFGCLKYKHYLVGVWLIFGLIVAINFPIAIFGTIFHFGGYRESTGFNNVFMALLFQIVAFGIFLFCARLVYSYFLQLKNRQSSPNSANVV